MLGTDLALAVLALTSVLAASIEVGPETVTYVGVGTALALLFRLVFRTLSRNDTEMVRLVGNLRSERDRAVAWQVYERGRADHWYARALGDPNPPPLPEPPADPPPTIDLAPVPPPG